MYISVGDIHRTSSSITLFFTMAPEPKALSDLPTMRSDEIAKPIPTFADAVHSRLNNPLVSLFRLGSRVLQLVFALAAGISYAVELSHGSTSSAYIYSQVVFGLTLIMLVFDALTLRSYRLAFIAESTLCVLWLALFGTFYQIFLGEAKVDSPETMGANRHRMRAAVWIDLVNFLLWVASAAFSTAMCCSGTKAMISGKMEKRRRMKQRKGGDQAEAMERGILRDPLDHRSEDRLPLYEEVAALARRD